MTTEESQRESSANMGLLQTKYTENQGRITRFAIQRFYQAFERMLAQVDAESVLDAGCGEGYILGRFLTSRFASV